MELMDEFRQLQDKMKVIDRENYTLRQNGGSISIRSSTEVGGSSLSMIEKA